MMKRLPLSLLSALAALFAAHAAAQVQTTYGGCVDAAGRPVPTIADTTLAVVAQAGSSSGGEVRYNPHRLPRLLPASRDFLFAHECARVHLALPLGENRSERDARQADCEAVAMLLRSGLVDDDKLRAVENDLVLSPVEWTAVPGPVRTFALTSCVAELRARPSLASPAQASWNACVRSCGESLHTCRAPCAGVDCSACTDGYERCTSLCDFQ